MIDATKAPPELMSLLQEMLAAAAGFRSHGDHWEADMVESYADPLESYLTRCYPVASPDAALTTGKDDAEAQ